MTEAPHIEDQYLVELSRLVRLEHELDSTLSALDSLKLLGDGTIKLPTLLEMTIQLITQRTAVQSAIAKLRSTEPLPPTIS